MAEGYEENVRNLVRGIAATYVDLRDAYLALPLPVELPSAGNMSGDLQEVHKAVIEATDLVDDLPVDPIAATALVNASMQWISITVLAKAYIATEGGPSFLATAVWALEQTADLTELAITLLRQV